MRLLVEIVIIGTLISLAWDRPLREWSDRANTAAQTFLHSKRETASGVTTIPAPTAPQKREETLGKSAVRKLSPGRYKRSGAVKGFTRKHHVRNPSSSTLSVSIKIATKQ